jgi:hypothetical protein
MSNKKKQILRSDAISNLNLGGKNFRHNWNHILNSFKAETFNKKLHNMQGTLTEVDSSLRLTSSLRYAVL